MLWPIPQSFSHAFLSLVVCGLLATSAGCGAKEEAKTNSESAEASDTAEASIDNSEADTPIQDAAPSGPEAQLRADLDDAIALLEKGEVALFLESYAPLEALGRMREESSIEELVQEHKEEIRKDMLPVLQKLAGGEVEFLDKDKSRAVIRPKADATADAPDDLTAPDFSVTDPAEEKTPHFEGFKGDVKEAIQQAAAALEAGDHKKFVENFFPESELARATSEEGLETIAIRLKEHPEMAKRMIADLKALEALTPEVDAQETTATFQMSPKTPQARTIRFEKRGTWRMADTAKAIRTEMHKQSEQSLKPLKTQKSRDEIEWIRIRDHWRISNAR